MFSRLLTTLALAAASAFTLAVASPAWACPNCDDCPHKADHHAPKGKAAKKAGEKAPAAAPKQEADKAPQAAPAPGEKKADAAAPAGTLVAAGCDCEKTGKCTCPKGECTCKGCPHAKASGAVSAAPDKCQCEKGGKNCTCPKGKCTCENCKAHRKAA